MWQPKSKLVTKMCVQSLKWQDNSGRQVKHWELLLLSTNAEVPLGKVLKFELLQWSCSTDYTIVVLTSIHVWMCITVEQSTFMFTKPSFNNISQRDVADKLPTEKYSSSSLYCQQYNKLIFIQKNANTIKYQYCSESHAQDLLEPKAQQQVHFHRNLIK